MLVESLNSTIYWQRSPLVTQEVTVFAKIYF
jgi:hypothetical protein